MHVQISRRFLPLLVGTALAGLVLGLAYPTAQAVTDSVSLQAPTGGLESCVEIRYLNFTEADSDILLTTEYRNACNVALPGGRVRLIALDEAGNMIEDGWSQIPALAPGQALTDDTVFQEDLSKITTMGHSDLAIWVR